MEGSRVTLQESRGPVGLKRSSEQCWVASPPAEILAPAHQRWVSEPLMDQPAIIH